MSAAAMALISTVGVPRSLSFAGVTVSPETKAVVPLVTVIVAIDYAA
jgi:hypothetical protein